MVTMRTHEEVNGFRANLKRQRVDEVREFSEGYERVARSVQPGECEEGYGDMNTLPKNNGCLHGHRFGTNIVRDFCRGCDKVRSYSEDNMVSARTHGKENRYLHNPKRQRVDVVREFTKDYETVARSVQSGERKEGYGDMNTLPKNNDRLHGHRGGTGVVRYLSQGYDKVGSYPEGHRISARTPRKENGFHPSPKRPTFNGVRELSRSYAPLARNVQPTRVGNDIVRDFSRPCDKLRSYTEGSMVSVGTPGKENGFHPNLKRPSVNAVRELPKGYGHLARNVRPGKCEKLYEDMNTLPKNNGRLHGHRVGTNVVRGFSVGHGRIVRRVQPGQCEKGYGNRDKSPRKNVRLHRHRVDIDVVRGGCDKVGGSYSKDARAKHLVVPLIEDKEGEKLCRARNSVEQALAAYEEALTKLGDPCDPNYRKLKGFTLHTSAAKYIKEKWVNTYKRIGNVPGVRVGDKFRYRPELAVVGLHRPYQSGIDYKKVKNRIVATSVVDSGRYANRTESTEVLRYIGQGGNPKVAKGEVKDQLAVRGNLALMNSKVARYPVRVIRKYNLSDKESGYVYDGLYTVTGWRKNIGEFDKLVYEFTLRRVQGQPALGLGRNLDGDAEMKKSRRVQGQPMLGLGRSLDRNAEMKK